MDSNGGGYREHRVSRGPYRLYAREYQGEEPAIVLLHGFPDDLHLYDRLVPELAPRRVVVFDFLGWGVSDKPSGYPYTAGNQTGDLGGAGGPRRLRPARDRLGAGAPRPGRGAGAAQHLLLAHARATPSRGDSAVLDPHGPVRRPPDLAAVRRPAVPGHVPLAGGALLPRSGGA